MKQQLTYQQKKIVDEIIQLHIQNKPLNIDAVKRHSPNILKKVYEIYPYWGWLGALRSAGLDYSDIRVEVLDFIVCKICGAAKANMATHLRRTHQLEPEEYREEYPGASLVCDLARSRHARMKCSVLRHWEPTWSKEYVLDRIAEFHRRGLSVNSADVKRIDSNFIGEAGRFFGNWSNALRAVGLDPAQLYRDLQRTRRTYPDKQAVLREIQIRHKKGLPINSGRLQSGQTRNYALWESATDYFGTWNNALKAAGIDPEIARKDGHHRARHYQDEKAVLAEIRNRQKKGLPLHCSGLIEGRHKDVTLFRAAQQLFGSWSAALQQVGIDIQKVRRSLFAAKRR